MSFRLCSLWRDGTGWVRMVMGNSVIFGWLNEHMKVSNSFAVALNSELKLDERKLVSPLGFYILHNEDICDSVMVVKKGFKVS